MLTAKKQFWYSIKTMMNNNNTDRYKVYWKSQSGSNSYLVFDHEKNKIVENNMSKDTAATLYKTLIDRTRPENPISWKSAKETVLTACQVNETYNPTASNNLKIFTEHDDEDSILINSYERPEWRTKGKTIKGNVDKYVMPFMNHLFNGDQEVIKHVLDWMAIMVQGKRNEIILCLIGEQGVGKGLFGDLCRDLVGPAMGSGKLGSKNWAKVSTTTFSGTHNGELKNKQFIHFEEAYVGKGLEQVKVMNNIKRLNSDEIFVRSMYRDAVAAKNYASLMVCSNHFAAIPAERGQRRFWTVGITKTKIQNSRLIFDAMFNDQRHSTIADAIKETLLSPETIREFGYMLLERDAKRLLSPPDVGDRFDEISNMWDAQSVAYRSIFEYHKFRELETGRELNHHEFARLLSEAVPRYGTAAYQVTQDIVMDIVYYSALYHKYILASHPVPMLQLIENADRTYSIKVAAGVPREVLQSLKPEHDEQREASSKITELKTPQNRKKGT